VAVLTVLRTWSNRRLLAVLLLLIGLLSHAAAEDLERQLKAAFLYRFAQFVEWPHEAGGEPSRQLVLCMLGTDVFEGALNSIAGKTVRERELVVKFVASPRQLGQCHMVFLAEPGPEVLKTTVNQGRQAHVLTVSDQPGFAASGGMIELLRQNNRLQFEINLGAAREAGLVVSSNLLRLARRIYE
jgi:hypothetical protein